MHNRAERLLRLKEVLAATGLSRSTLYRAVACPEGPIRFPRPVKMGRLSAWPESEVLAWIERRKADRAAA